MFGFTSDEKLGVMGEKKNKLERKNSERAILKNLFKNIGAFNENFSIEADNIWRREIKDGDLNEIVTDNFGQKAEDMMEQEIIEKIDFMENGLEEKLNSYHQLSTEILMKYHEVCNLLKIEVIKH